MEDMYHHVFPVTQIPLPPSARSNTYFKLNERELRALLQSVRQAFGGICAAVGNGESWRSREFALREIYATEGGDGQEGWRGGSQSVSHSLSPPSLEARGSSSVVVRGPGTEVGTDLCDTHAARRITHSVAHNIHLPCPALDLTLPLLSPSFLTPKGIARWETDAPILSNETPTWRYLLRIEITLSRRRFPSRRGESSGATNDRVYENLGMRYKL